MASFDHFRDRSNVVLALDAIKLERRSELGSQLYFARAPQIVGALQKLLNSIDEDNSSVVPESMWAEIGRRVSRFTEITDEIADFNSQQSNPLDQRNQFENDLEYQYSEVFTLLAPAASATLASAESSERSGRLEKLENDINDRFSILASSAEQKVSEAESKLRETLGKATSQSELAAGSIVSLLEETRTRAAEVVSAKEAKHFELASDDFQKSSSRWLKVTIAGSFVLFIMAFIFLIISSLGFYDNMKATSVAQVGLSKVILFGILGYVTAQSAKNYFAAKHNEAVNRHRQNAILAYRALVEATGSPEHRDIVLTHAAAAVFAPQDTAFIKGRGGGTDLPATFINSVTKAVTPSH